MTKTVAITAIVSIAVIMGMSSVVPMMSNAYAGALPPPPDPEGVCPSDFQRVPSNVFPTAKLADRAQLIDEADGVADELVCTKTIITPRGVRTIIVDNNLPISTRTQG